MGAGMSLAAMAQCEGDFGSAVSCPVSSRLREDTRTLFNSVGWNSATLVFLKLYMVRLQVLVNVKYV